jgi:hypothetical protein
MATGKARLSLYWPPRLKLRAETKAAELSEESGEFVSLSDLTIRAMEAYLRSEGESRLIVRDLNPKGGGS